MVQAGTHQTETVGIGVETLKSETLSHVNSSISTEFDYVKCYTLMCLESKPTVSV